MINVLKPAICIAGLFYLYLHRSEKSPDSVGALFLPFVFLNRLKTDQYEYREESY